ncbi:MAG: ferritin [Bdellovibrionales bacterium]|jgi:ferritin|nr:ferritin [Bdellovibrionales bacterium]
MLTERQLDKLNDQIHAEASVSRLYLAISCWAASKGLNGVAKFFKNHHELEEGHMHRLEDYIIATGGIVKVGAIEAPPSNFNSVADVLKLALEKEVAVSASINEMVDFFFKEKNYSTFNFLQWFVAEQHEEEHLFRGLIEKAELIGSDQRGLYWLDKELGNTSAGK